MTLRRALIGVVIMGCVAISLSGCARAARDTTGFAVVESATVAAPFDVTWQATKAVLRERDMDIYTRDKRGVFVGFTKMRRNLALVPKRSQYTIYLEPVSDGSTRVTVKAIRQVYGVTLLTYPGWHDRKMEDPAEAQAILAAVTGEAQGAQPS